MPKRKVEKIQKIISVLERTIRDNPGLEEELIEYSASAYPDIFGSCLNLSDFIKICEKHPDTCTRLILEFIYRRVVNPILEAYLRISSIGVPGVEDYIVSLASQTYVHERARDVRRRAIEVLLMFKKLCNEFGYDYRDFLRK